MDRRRKRDIGRMENLNHIPCSSFDGPTLNNGVFRDDFGQAAFGGDGKKIPVLPNDKEYAALVLSGNSEIYETFPGVWYVKKDNDDLLVALQYIDRGVMNSSNYLIRMPVATAYTNGTRAQAVLGRFNLETLKGYLGIFSMDGNVLANNLGAIQKINELTDVEILVERPLPKKMAQYDICNVEFRCVNGQMSFDIQGIHIGVVTDTAVRDQNGENDLIVFGSANTLIGSGTAALNTFGVTIVPL